GSFINVVVHRVPHGRTVVRGRSACPACGHVVRPRDNVPVLGWLLLGGRCRDCKSPISPAYAVVEAACGLSLAALAAAEIVAWRSAGSSLPLVERALVLEEWAWLGGWAGRAAATLTVFAWTLLARRGHVVTWRTACVAAALVAGLAAAGAASPARVFVQALGGAAVGWAVGWVTGRGVRWATSSRSGGPAVHRILMLVGVPAAGCWPAVAAWFRSLRGG
ncbi:prepilin peptidase, partial [bacterium]|nr:prepilin peptidase [bacterium]